MARPAKNNADYFPHDAGMRNHRKVKALRNKFTITGYAIWCMLLEHLTGSDGNEFENSDSELELMAGDFGVSVTEIRDVINYCISLELLFTQNGFIYSESLNERLAPVYAKRGVAKELSKKQRRINGKFVSSNADSPVVSVTEIPQSKVKQSKVDDIKILIPFVGSVLVSWNEWEQFRIEKKQKLTPSTVKKQIQFLGGRGDPEIIAIINQSITQGWTGLFELKTNTNGNRNTTKTNARGPDSRVDISSGFGKL